MLTIDENTTLRPLSEENAEELFQLTDRNRPYLREWLPWLDITKSPEDSQRFIQTSAEKFQNQAGYVFGIWFNNQLVGVIDLHGIDKSNKSASIGYWLGAEFQGHGLMTKATPRIIRYAFEQLKLHRIVIRAATGNQKSQAIPTRLNFHKEGIERQAEWLYDHYVDLQVYSILEDEYGHN